MRDHRSHFRDYPDVPGIPLFKEQVDAIVKEMEKLTGVRLRGQFTLHMSTNFDDDLVQWMRDDGPHYYLGLTRFRCGRPEVSVSWRNRISCAPTRELRNTSLAHELVHVALHLQGRHMENREHQGREWGLVPDVRGDR